jgi:AcrR family transcriptional regulator
MPAGAEQLQRAQETRAAILVAARNLFAARGYRETSTEEVVASAGITRGALYHHFAGKKALFEAVFEAVELELVARFAVPAPQPSDPWERFSEGVQTLLNAALEPDVRRILLLDGPVVLGWDAWLHLEHRHGLGLFVGAIRAAIDEGVLPDQSPEVLATILIAVVNAGAALITTAEDPVAVRQQVGTSIAHLIGGLGYDRSTKPSRS